MDSEVAVHGVGGTAFTREKYFIDCLVMCVRGALRAARKTFGVPDVSVNLDDAETGHIIYTTMEMNLLRGVIKSALAFVMDGEIKLHNKVYKKWSALRPVLQAWVLKCYETVVCMHWSALVNSSSVCVCVCACLNDCLGEHAVAWVLRVSF